MTAMMWEGLRTEGSEVSGFVAFRLVASCFEREGAIKV